MIRSDTAAISASAADSRRTTSTSAARAASWCTSADTSTIAPIQCVTSPSSVSSGTTIVRAQNQSSPVRRTRSSAEVARWASTASVSSRSPEASSEARATSPAAGPTTSSTARPVTSVNARFTHTTGQSGRPASAITTGIPPTRAAT
jgi:hypothetical protein